MNKFKDFILENDIDNYFKLSLEGLNSEDFSDESVGSIPINEAVGVSLIISLMLAAPGIIERIAKAVGWVINKIRKLFGKEKKEFEFIEKLIEFAEKWATGYVVAIEKILDVTGIFKKAGMTEKKEKREVATIIYYLCPEVNKYFIPFRSNLSQILYAHNHS